MLYYGRLRYAGLGNAMLFCTMMYYAMLCYAMVFDAELCYGMICNTGPEESSVCGTADLGERTELLSRGTPTMAWGNSGQQNCCVGATPSSNYPERNYCTEPGTSKSSPE